MLLIKLISYFLFHVFLGYAILILLGINKDFNLFEILAIAYGIGMALASICIFIFKFNFSFSFIFLIIISLVIFFIKRKNLVFNKPLFIFSKLSRLEGFLLTAIILIILKVFIEAVIYPMESYDSVVIWGLKAKAIYLRNMFPWDLNKTIIPQMHHLDYPLFIPLQEAFFYKFLARFEDAICKLIFPFWFFLFLVIFYFLLRRVILRLPSLAFTFFLASASQFNKFATNGYADFPVAFYFSLGFIFLYLWYLQGNKSFLFLSAIFSAITGWVKNEGIAWCLINFILFILAIFLKENRNNIKQEAKKGLIIYIIMIILFILPWHIFKLNYGLKNDLFIGSSFLPLRLIKNFKRLFYIIYAYQKQFFDLKRWNLTWVIFLVTFFLGLRKKFLKKFIIFWGCFLLYFGILGLVFILTPHDLHWHLRTTVSRLFIHFVPIAIFWLVIFSKERRFI